jgi:glyoxylase-like metal-dependent hydrolase (beta-lactamase superfamily II)
VTSGPDASSALALGPVRLDSVLDGRMGVAPRVMYPHVTAQQWAGEAGGYLGQDGNVPLDYGGYLVRGPGDRVILVDTGGGTRFSSVAGKSVLYEGEGLLDSLAALAVKPAEITDVVFTHLHFDHTGWASRDGKPTFPRATYWCHRADWAMFVDGPADERIRNALLPVAELVRTWTEEAAVVPWLRLVGCPGHTPGNAIVVVDGGHRRLALIGDLAHHPLEFEHPDWHGGLDWDPAVAADQRTRWFGRFADESILVASPHFPRQRALRVRRAGPAFSCAEVDA